MLGGKGAKAEGKDPKDPKNPKDPKAPLTPKQTPITMPLQGDSFNNQWRNDFDDDHDGNRSNPAEFVPAAIANQQRRNIRIQQKPRLNEPTQTNVTPIESPPLQSPTSIPTPTIPSAVPPPLDPIPTPQPSSKSHSPNPTQKQYSAPPNNKSNLIPIALISSISVVLLVLLTALILNIYYSKFKSKKTKWISMDSDSTESYAPTVIDESNCSTPITHVLGQLESTWVQTAHSTLTFDQSNKSTPNWF